MEIGFNGASTMKTDLYGDILAASKAGFDYIEIWLKKLEAYLSEDSIDNLVYLFKKANIRPLALNSVEFITFNSSWEKINIMNLIKKYAEIADRIDCPYIVIIPSPIPEGVTDRDVFNESVEVLTEISQKFENYRVRFAFEFLGFNWCSVTTLEQDFEIIREVGRNNIGLVLDTFHFYTGGSTMESIGKVDKDKIFIFHINDAEDLPTEELQDANRLFPGEGIIPIKEIINKLKGIGYSGPISLEMFRPEYWKLSPEDVARKGIQAVKRFTESV